MWDSHLVYLVLTFPPAFPFVYSPHSICDLLQCYSLLTEISAPRWYLTNHCYIHHVPQFWDKSSDAMKWDENAFSKISCWNVGPPLFQFCLLSVVVHHFHRLKAASCPWEIDSAQCVSEFSLSGFSRLQLMGYGWGYWKGARKCFVSGLALCNYTISVLFKPC